MRFWLRFPGGKFKPNETPENALKREIMEELGHPMDQFTFFMEIHHDYPKYSVHIRFYLAHVDEKIKIERKSHDDLKWIDPKEVGEIDFLEANRPVIEKLMKI